MTHQAVGVAIYHSLPDAAKDFLRLSEVEMHWYARVPDEVAGDNVLVSGGCAIEEAYAHSYKLAWDRETDTFAQITGSAPSVIAETPRLARNAVREGEFDVAREHLAKVLSHYAVDLTTIWHVTRELSSAQHKNGEGDVAKVVKHRGAITLPVTPTPLSHPKSLYYSAIDAAEQTNRLFLDRAKADQALDDHLHNADLMKEMLNHCASFGMAAFLYCWKFVERA